MERKKFIDARNELLATMIKDKHCAKSVAAVRSCSSIKTLASVLGKFRIELAGENFPTISWLRKWFTFEREVLADNGVLLDCWKEITNYEKEVTFLFGHSCLTVESRHIPIKYIVCRNQSKVRIYADGFSLWHVLLQDESECEIVEKSEHSRIILIDKRKKL
ncbi:MAG: hypothetical protein PHH23_01750 [Paludibacteraceae bacterium]|nr:hypothetical protein [Paludibacteraceae bacterium]